RPRDPTHRWSRTGALPPRRSPRRGHPGADGQRPDRRPSPQRRLRAPAAGQWPAPSRRIRPRRRAHPPGSCSGRSCSGPWPQSCAIQTIPDHGQETPEQTRMSAVDDLLNILDIEPLEVNLFRGRSPQTSWQRVFGGQVIGQALVATCRTVDDVAARPPHSLHAYFLIGGDPKVPIIYEVDRIRDGRSFTTRRVVAI